jgi:hypothetical protein
MSVDLRGRTTARAVGCQAFTAEGRVLPQVRVRFVVDRVVLGQVCIQSTLVFPCSCHHLLTYLLHGAESFLSS